VDVTLDSDMLFYLHEASETKSGVLLSWASTRPGCAYTGLDVQGTIEVICKVLQSLDKAQCFSTQR